MISLKRSWILALGLVFVVAVGCSPKAEDAAKSEGTTLAKGDNKSADPKADANKPPMGKPEGSKSDSKPGVNTPKDTKPKAPPKPPSGDPSKYTGSFVLSLTKEQETINKQLTAKGKPAITGTLDIKADGTYVMKFGTTKNMAETMGNVQSFPDRVVLSPVDGKAQGDKRMVLRFDKDGKTLLASNEDPETGKKSGPGMQLRFRKK